MKELPADVRRSLESGLDALHCGGVRHVEHEGHSFAIVKLSSTGMHTGSPRFLVACRTCFNLIHEGTTGAIENIEVHLRGVEAKKGIDSSNAEMINARAQATELMQLRAKALEPIPMRLICPECKALHIDAALADKPHHTHACQNCGNVWRPALVNTVGVRFLPGYKDES